ncbi:hypothetical protein EYF80_064701 [Liparis tanakae]|uniref:Secreted protein n=1 Tax=Liparis tanakae TaxID=230148 RepID=A0A4Z2E8T6_9TELE|nr:hypothetical protein EYF80_064701 [Liparis tanakae]
MPPLHAQAVLLFSCCTAEAGAASRSQLRLVSPATRVSAHGENQLARCFCQFSHDHYRKEGEGGGTT